MDRRHRASTALATFLALGLCAACARGPSDEPGARPTGSPSGQAAATLRVVRDVPLPGGTSRFDYQSYDPQAHRLYVAHLGAGEVVVFDTSANAVVGTVKNTPGVHGVLVVPELGRLFAAATDSREIVAIDTGSLAVAGRAQGDGYVDGLAYEPKTGKLYVSDEQGGSETVADARSVRRLGAVSVGGEAGNTQYDPSSGHIAVAVQTRDEVVEIDPASDTVVARHPTPGCQHPHGLLIDPQRHRAFVACQGNARLLVLEQQTGWSVLTTQDVGRDPDVLALDPTTGRVYVAAESGPLAVFAEDERGVHLLVRQDAGPNAHSVAVDPQTHHVYLPLQNLNGAPVLREMALEGGAGPR